MEVIRSDLKERNGAFLGFYHDLYSSEYSDSALHKQKEFLDSLEFTPLNGESLELNLGAQELSDAIISLKGLGENSRT